jgi:diacylglycerol kinase
MNRLASDPPTSKKSTTIPERRGTYTQTGGLGKGQLGSWPIGIIGELSFRRREVTMPDPVHDEFQPTNRSWNAKFKDAFVGVTLGVRGQSSFRVHLLFAAAVIALGAILQVTRVEWRLLVLCIAAVLTAELFNSALERMAKAIDSRRNPELGAALDIASGAVLLAAAGAAIVGAEIFLYRLGILMKWWPG